MILQLIMKEANTSLPRVGLWQHISNRRTYIEQIALSRGCSQKDAIVVTELALDCVKDKATERPMIDEVIDTLANL